MTKLRSHQDPKTNLFRTCLAPLKCFIPKRLLCFRRGGNTEIDPSRTNALYPEVSYIPDANTTDADARKPTAIDRKYVMKPYQFRFDSANRLIATLSNDNQDEVRTIATIERKHHEDDSASTGVFRLVHVLFDDDPEKKKAAVQSVLHDTGSGCSLTFRGKLEALGLRYARLEDDAPLLQSVTGDKFKPVGFRSICFSYVGVSKKEWWTDLIVLEDPKDESLPGFDILFGRDCLFNTKALKFDPEVIGPGNICFVKDLRTKLVREKLDD